MAKKQTPPGPSTKDELKNDNPSPQNDPPAEGSQQTPPPEPTPDAELHQASPEPSPELPPESSPNKEPQGDQAELLIYVSRAASPGYRTNRIDTRLDDVQSRGLRALFDGLHQRHEKLANGRHVDSPADAVRWLLEQVGGNL